MFILNFIHAVCAWYAGVYTWYAEKLPHAQRACKLPYCNRCAAGSSFQLTDEVMANSRPATAEDVRDAMRVGFENWYPALRSGGYRRGRP